MASSGFRDAFTRSDKDNVLSYDDAAFLYFSGAILSCLVLPWTYFFLRSLFRRPARTPSSAPSCCCKCSVCTASEAKRISEENSFKKRCCSKWFILNAVALLGLWAGLVAIAVQASGTRHSIAAFDPYEILELTSGASTRDIRRAYRTLSLKHHPDKHQNSPEAAAKFILIAKAYQTLTDETSRLNYEKYGNPDGPGFFKIGVGLPHLLVQKEHQLAILLVFFTVLLVIVPGIFVAYYQRQRKYAPDGKVLMETLAIFVQNMKEQSRARQFTELFAASAESRENTRIRRTDNEEMATLMKALDEPLHLSKGRLLFNHPLIARNSLLLSTHLHRMHKLLSPSLRDDLDALLKQTEALTEVMLEIACYRNWLNTAHAVIHFRRCLVQAIDPTANPASASLLQLPHFQEDLIRHCLRGKNAVRDIKGFVAQDLKDRKGMASMSKTQIDDVTAFCACAPRLALQTRLYVAGESDIVEGDVITLDITMNRDGRDGSCKMDKIDLRKEQGLIAHAPFFPARKHERWMIFLTEKHAGKLIGFAEVGAVTSGGLARMQFIAAKGRNTLTLNLLCDSYLGFDETVEVQYTAADSATASTRSLFVHEEDEALDEHPTLLQQMMTANPTCTHSDHEEEKDADEDLDHQE